MHADLSPEGRNAKHFEAPRLDKAENRRADGFQQPGQPGWIDKSGGVAEWLKATVLKTVEPQGSVGSNPTASAIENRVSGTVEFHRWRRFDSGGRIRTDEVESS